MRVMVVGASGLVGGAVVRAWERAGDDVIATYHRTPVEGGVHLDVTQAGAIQAATQEHRPQVIALTVNFPGGVDAAERDPEGARRVLVDATADAAEAARALGARVVLYSTDYVFDGARGPYGEDDSVRPLSVYGRLKAEAEAAAGPSALILRTTAVFGWQRQSKNVAMQVWTTLGAGQVMEAPVDQITTPTLAEYLAEVTVRLVQQSVTGIVNVVGKDRVSRADLAARIAKAFSLDAALIRQVETGAMRNAAPRPLRAGLTTERLLKLLGTEPLSLAESLTRLRRQWRSDTHLPMLARATSGPAKDEVLDAALRFHRTFHAPKAFAPFKSRVPYAGRVYDEDEMRLLIDSALDLWITAGPWAEQFETRMKEFYHAKDFAFVNSGSTANLTAVLALMSPQLSDRLRSGDEVITPAVTFPTTLSPIVHSGLVPVFVDCDVGTYNVRPEELGKAIGPKTRAMFLPHTLGNPFDLDVVLDLCERHDLWLIEDACDALGSRFRGKLVGTYGDLATNSYFPAHHITTGEGGGVVVNNPKLSRIVRSVRDWGRDCWCAPGENNSCGKRFGWKAGQLPEGYDHKFIFSNLGYNFKATDLQGALGVAQAKKIPSFVEARKRNFARLHAGLQKHRDQLELPRLDSRSDPSWFGYPITVRPGVDKRALVAWLDRGNIDTRPIFAGNILRQPGYEGIPHRVVGDLAGSERIMRDSFFLGVYPGLNDAMLDFVISQVDEFFAAPKVAAAT